MYKGKFNRDCITHSNAVPFRVQWDDLQTTWKRFFYVVLGLSLQIYSFYLLDPLYLLILFFFVYSFFISYFSSQFPFTMFNFTTLSVSSPCIRGKYACIILPLTTGGREEGRRYRRKQLSTGMFSVVQMSTLAEI